MPDKTLYMAIMLFAVFALVFYSSMHALFYFRVRVLLPPGTLAHLLVLSFLAIMIVAPFANHILAMTGHPTAAKAVAHVGYPWMGFLFLCLCCGLAIRVFNLISRIACAFLNKPVLEISGPVPVIILLLIAAALFIWGINENTNLKIKRLVLHTNKLPESCEQITIAQISDIHLGFMTNKKYLQSVVDAVSAFDPDILVSTGDLVDAHLVEMDGFELLLKKMPAKLGKFAVTGNHEAYFDTNAAMKFTEACGFMVLRGTGLTVGGVINIAGVDDLFLRPKITDGQILTPLQNGLFTVLLKHQPRVDKNAARLFDLQLSGHCHGGQIFPLHFLVKLAFPYFAGFYLLESGAVIYVSRGTGSWGPQIRIASKPEVTLITIKRK